MTQERKFYIVWNDGRSEGFITDDEDDARQCLAGNYRSGSTVGIAFSEAYEDDDRSLEVVNLATISDPQAFMEAARGMREALASTLEQVWDDWHAGMDRAHFEKHFATEFAALAAFDATLGEQ